MTAQDKAKLADRMRREARKDRVAKILRQFSGDPSEMLALVDSDAKWWRAWVLALGIGAVCPSHEERALVREAIRVRLPELHVLTQEDRDLLAILEAARNAATAGAVWCSVCEGTGIERDDEEQFPCTNTVRHEP